MSIYCTYNIRTIYLFASARIVAYIALCIYKNRVQLYQVFLTILGIIVGISCGDVLSVKENISIWFEYPFFLNEI